MNPLGVSPIAIGVSTVIHSDFENMVRLAFAQATTDQDFMAILKRCVYIVFSERAYFIRLPGAAKKDVQVKSYLGTEPDLLLESCKPRIAEYRAGASVCPPPADLEWSVVLTRKALRGEDFITHLDTQFDEPCIRPSAGAATGSAGASSSSVPSVPAATVPVKRERSGFRFALRKEANVIIDLDSDEDNRPKKEVAQFHVSWGGER